MRGTEVSAILGRLAQHYWRPEMTAQQTKWLVADFLSDLAAYSPARIEWACGQYRRDPENRFFPTPGQLLGILDSNKPTPCRLPTFSGLPALESPRATKSVAEVLEEHGMTDKAAMWRSRQQGQGG